MTENHADDGAVRNALFAVYVEPPWLLHLSGELDLGSAPALTIALERPIRRGGTIGLDLANLTYMDSTGIHVIFNTVQLLGERGRVVLYNPPPIVRRLIEICALVGTTSTTTRSLRTTWIDRLSADLASRHHGPTWQVPLRRSERPDYRTRLSGTAPPPGTYPIPARSAAIAGERSRVRQTRGRCA